MASPTQWKQVWANSGRQWRTGKPGMLQSMGSDRTEQLNNRSGSKDLKKLNPLYKFKQFIYDAWTGTLVCAFKHNKIILSHWRNLNSSRSVTWHPGTQHAVVPLMKGLAETANIQNHSNNKINSFQWKPSPLKWPPIWFHMFCVS